MRARDWYSGATADGPYRYRLWRRWDQTLRPAFFVMLNPSTADAARDDPTIRRCIAFAKSWGYGGIEIGNLFAYRMTDPRGLVGLGEEAIVGPENDAHLVAICQSGPGIVVAAWGGRAPERRARSVRNLLEVASRGSLYCLGSTKSGQPRHPLYLPGQRRPVRFV